MTTPTETLLIWSNWITKVAELEKEIKKPKPDVCNDGLKDLKHRLNASLDSALKEWGTNESHANKTS